MTLDMNEVDVYKAAKLMANFRGYETITEYAKKEADITPQCFTLKLRNNTLRFKDFLELCNDLGFDVKLESRENFRGGRLIVALSFCKGAGKYEQIFKICKRYTP